MRSKFRYVLQNFPGIPFDILAHSAIVQNNSLPFPNLNVTLSASLPRSCGAKLEEPHFPDRSHQSVVYFLMNDFKIKKGEK